MRHRASRLTPQPLTPTRRLTTAAALLSVVAASGVAVAISSSFASAPTNLIANSSFEHNLTGWTKLSSPLHLTRARAGHDGSWSAALTDSSVSTVVLKDTPNTVRSTHAGAVFHASVWVMAPKGTVDAILRVREVKGGVLVGQRFQQVRLSDKRWHEISFTYATRTSGASLDYNVLARNLAVGRVLLVDDTWLSTPGVTAPTPTPTHSTPAPTPSVTPTPTPTPTQTPTPTPTPTTTPTTTPTPTGHTLFGSSIYQNPGETFAAAYQRRVSMYGQLGIDRVFYPGLPQPWPGNAGYSGGPVIVSFKVAPQQVLTGAYDATLSSWFATAPRGRNIWWSYYHEPEDQIASGAFTAAEYRAAWQHIAALADAAGNPDLHATLILMCYTLSPSSGRTFTDYYPGSTVIDTLGFDCYNTMASKDSYIAPSSQFAAVLALSASLGKPYGIAEFGSTLVAGDSGATRASWLVASGAFLNSNGAQWVSYFDSPVAGEYRLLDAPSQAAWRTVVTTM